MSYFWPPARVSFGAQYVSLGWWECSLGRPRWCAFFAVQSILSAWHQGFLVASRTSTPWWPVAIPDIARRTPLSRLHVDCWVGILRAGHIRRRGGYDTNVDRLVLNEAAPRPRLTRQAPRPAGPNDRLPTMDWHPAIQYALAVSTGAQT